MSTSDAILVVFAERFFGLKGRCGRRSRRTRQRCIDTLVALELEGHPISSQRLETKIASARPVALATIGGVEPVVALDLARERSRKAFATWMPGLENAAVFDLTFRWCVLAGHDDPHLTHYKPPANWAKHLSQETPATPQEEIDRLSEAVQGIVAAARRRQRSRSRRAG